MKKAYPSGDDHSKTQEKLQDEKKKKKETEGKKVPNLKIIYHQCINKETCVGRRRVVLEKGC